MTFNNGDPIIPRKLVEEIESRYKSLINTIIGFVPLGFNFAYEVIAQKIFKVRPKSIASVYSTRSGSDVNDINANRLQPNIGSYFLGSPWTITMGNTLGLNEFQDVNTGSTEEPYIKAVDKLPYNPTTLLFGGVPLRGNSPLIFNGYLGLNNSFEDTNIRVYVDPTGQTLTVKAKSISMMTRPRNYNDFTIGTDSISNESDRFNMELDHLQDVSISIDYNNPFSQDSFGNGQSGYFPNTLATRNKVGDFGIWLVRNKAYNSYHLIRVPWDVPLDSVLSIVNDPYNIGGTSFNDYYPQIDYLRPIACVYCDGTGFKVSNRTAWDEEASTFNADYRYGKLYQQCTTSDPSLFSETIENDRRIVPSYFYIDLQNSVLISNTCFSGLIRHIPGAGGNQVRINNYYTNSEQEAEDSVVDIEVKQCEVTNGTYSIWLRDINLSIPKKSFLDVDAGASAQRGYYIWLTANPSSLLDDTSNNNLRIKIVASTSATWDADGEGNSGVDKTNLTGFDYRCRIGWFGFGAGSTSVLDSWGTSSGYTSYDGFYYFTEHDLNSSGTAYLLEAGNTGGLYQDINLNTCKLLPKWGYEGTAGEIGTSLACEYVLVELLNSSGTAGQSGTSFVGLTTDSYRTSFGLTGDSPSPLLDACYLGINVTSGTKIVEKTQTFLLPTNTTDTLRFCASGNDGGAFEGYKLKSAWVRGFYLPFSFN